MRGSELHGKAWFERLGSREEELLALWLALACKLHVLQSEREDSKHQPVLFCVRVSISEFILDERVWSKRNPNIPLPIPLF